MAKLRLIWVANAIWCPTGYGIQSKSLLPRLKRLDCVDDIAIFAFWGSEGGIMKAYGFTHYPRLFDPWGNDVIQLHARHFKADAVFTLMDTWVLAPDYGVRGFRWLPYFPVDHSPCPPAIIERLRTAYLPISYSRFGWEEMRKAGVYSEFIPHGVEEKVFRPLPDKGKWKEKFGLSRDDFVVGMVAANKGYPARKAWQQCIEGFAAFAQRHKDARLYLHTLTTSEMGGPNLREMLAFYGCIERARFTNPYYLMLGFDQPELAQLYNSFDVLLAASMGEGFGIPILEAQSCGVPVVTTDFSSMPELTAAGWKAKVLAKWFTPLVAHQVIPDPQSIAECLERAYEADRGKLAKVGREFALGYSWDKLVAQKWAPLLKQIAEEVTVRSHKPIAMADLVPASELYSRTATDEGVKL